MEMILRIFMIVLGIVLLGKTFASLAKRILTEHFGMLWGFFCGADSCRNPFKSDRMGELYQPERSYSGHDYYFLRDRSGLVHQHPGIAVNTEESGTRHAGIAVESGE